MADVLQSQAVYYSRNLSREVKKGQENAAELAGHRRTLEP
jgi:hypothetical protein